jgi:hypothetical protein
MLSQKEKVRRMLGSFVGGSVSVATIAVVSSFQMSLQATFLDLKVFQNAAYYEIEIIENLIVDQSSSLEEEPLPPEPLPIRLWVENQWENFEVSLSYGFNQGELSPLRENENYALTIQYQGNLGWTTLATETIKTAPRLLGNISDFSFDGSYLEETIDVSMNVSTQAGFRPVERFEVVLSQGEQQWAEDVPSGTTSLLFEDLPHQNQMYEVTVFAYIQNLAEEIFKQTYESLPFVHGTYERYFSAPGTLVVVPQQSSRTLQDEVYAFEVTTDETTFVQSWDGITSEIIFDNLPLRSIVSLSWFVLYRQSNALVSILVSEETVPSIGRPMLVLSKFVNGIVTTIQMTIDRTYDFTSLALYQGDRSLDFDLINQNDDARYYEITVEEAVTGSWELRVLLQESNPILYTLLVVQL